MNHASDEVSNQCKMREFCCYVIEDKIKKKKMKERRKGRRRRRKKGCSPIEMLSEQLPSEEIMTRRGRCNANANKFTRTSLLKGTLPFVLINLILLMGLTDFGWPSANGPSVAASAAGNHQQEIGEGLTLNGNRAANAQNPLSTTPSPQHLEKIKRESKVSALVGQNVILNCAVQFKDGVEEPFVVNWLKYPNQLPIYIWYAGYPAHVAQGYENRVSRIGQASLNLSQVRDSDQGLYLCKINYLDKGPEDKSTEIWNWMFLDVQAPPRFTQTPAPINYVQAGDSLHLTCQAESTPAPLLRWFKNKTPIDSDQGPYRLSAMGTSGEGRPALDTAQGQLNSSHHNGSTKQLFGAHQTIQLDLFIDNVQAGTTTGDYKCLASNSEGTIEARSQVVLAVPAVITAMPAEQTALEGEKVELVCQAKALPSNITYKWLFNDKPIQTLKWFESRHSIKRDGTLILHSVHRDDQGHFKCQATNGLSHRSLLPVRPATRRPTTPGKQGTISAGSDSNGTHTPPPIYAEAGTQLHVEYMARIMYSPSVQYLPLGLPGIIRCFFQASPAAKYYAWTFNDQQFDPDKDPNVERLNNGSLLLHQVSKQYEGKYMCAAFNKHGSAGTSAPMEVRVEEPPRFELKPADFYKATVNGNVKIPCDASGSPKPTVSWRKVLGPVKVPMKTAKVEPATYATTTTVSNAAMMAPPINDEAANEPDEQHFYSNEPSLGSHERSLSDMERPPPPPPPQASVSMEGADGDEAQQSVINYAKLPSDRSEYKNSHLLLHALRKDDLGRYECVVENEVATLIASTMLYIEETTPHAPTNLQVETKAWSAQLSWTPGYDGGFEQAFVIWYRQIERTPSNDEQQNQMAPMRGGGGQMNENRELVDLNWHSVNVQPSDSTSFVVQNLSQDTSYEFYVRAKNIIGEGPGSQTVLVTTKRAISGSLAPVNVMELAASVNPITDESSHVVTGTASSDDEDDGSTVNPSVISIIHLVDYTTMNPISSNDGSSSDSQSSASQTNSVQYQQQPVAINAHQANINNATTKQALNNLNRDDQNSGSNSTKVIRIFFPSKQQQQQTNLSNSSDSQNSTTNKRPRFDQPDQSNSNHSTDSPKSQEPTHLDMSTAPQNLSMTKVAQGWVLNWWPPEKNVPETSGKQSFSMPALSQVQINSDAISVPQQQQQQQQQQPIAYSVEYREKSSPSWLPLATSRERSLLLKDLKPDGEYMFRVFALNSVNSRGAPSAEFKYLIPDNRRKPGSTQALSAGVVSGVLFFIACIVIAVCAVNMCNKRRKKRAEKAAYVMMACPVLESHHDIAALNSNSLLKNGAPATEGRVPGVSGTGSSGSSPTTITNSSDHIGPDRAASSIVGRLARLPSHALEHVLRLLDIDGRESNEVAVGNCLQASTTKNQSDCQQQQQRINFTSNAPLPVDVNPTDRVDGATACLGPLKGYETNGQATTAASGQQINSQTPIDDYWVRKPSDRKWGTLTLAASRLAERRAREAARQMQAQDDHHGSSVCKRPTDSGGALQEPEVDSLADEYYASNRGSRTLPRSYGASPSMVDLRHHHYHQQMIGCDTLQLENQSRHQQFNSWLRDQLGAPNKAEGSRMFQQQQPNSTLAHQQQLQPQVQPRGLEMPLAFQSHHHHQQQQQLWPPQHQLQPQFNHQRSISQVEPSTLANYWLLQQNSSQLPAAHALTKSGPRHQPAPLWTGAGQPSVFYGHQYVATTQPPIGCEGGNFYSTQKHTNGQRLPAHDWIMDTNDAIAVQPIGKRNSLQRSTLPMAGSIHSAPQLVVKSAATKPGQPCPFYPIVGAGWINDSFHHNEPQPPLAPPLPPRPTVDDDPVTANACLGSYKRKRRLPHIEAQFTITPPELPPKQKQPATAEDQQSAARREREAVERGHLFVRAIHHQEPDKIKTENPLPRGMPQAGQRSEQRQLRPRSPLAQVETICAREKIETYLRHYDQQVEQEKLHSVSGDLNAADVTPPISNSPIQVDQVEEITFQPYHNLPSLKYTINLPLCRAQDGTLLFNETSHLRRSRRSRNPNRASHGPSFIRQQQHQPASNCFNSLTLGERKRAQVRTRRKPMGSSSSCPTPPAEFCGEMSCEVSKEASNLSPSAFSLESTIGQPTVGLPKMSTCRPIDSLENSLDVLNLSPKQQQHQAQQPFYLRSPTISPADYSSIRETLMVEVPSPPPPPVPPHRTKHAEVQPALDEPRPPEPEPRCRSPEQQDYTTLRRPVESRPRNSIVGKSSGRSGSSSQSPGSASDNSNSGQTLSSTSSTSSGSSSASAGTTTENGGDVSEVLTNDHSVDENYEFDQVSSCSSSTRRRCPTLESRASHTNDRFSQPKADNVVQVNEAIYSQVDKKTKKPPESSQSDIMPETSMVVVTRSQIYEESRYKQQSLSKVATPSHLGDNDQHLADYYDTVNEFERDKAHDNQLTREGSLHPH